MVGKLVIVANNRKAGGNHGNQYKSGIGFRGPDCKITAKTLASGVTRQAAGGSSKTDAPQDHLQLKKMGKKPVSVGQIAVQ